MIDKFVQIWDQRKNEIEEYFKNNHPSGYEDIVKQVIKILNNDYGDPNHEKIHTIDDGDYQGTLLFIIPENNYQPSRYWSVYVSYGSCSGCDTLQSIQDYDDGPPTESQTKGYMTLALHVLQELKEI
jgi:hypothetical protein